VSRRLRRILSLDDLEIAARAHLPRPIFAYVSGATERNASLADNAAAFAELGFVPRILADVSHRSTQAQLLGQAHAMPFGIAPMGLAALTAYRGDLVLARAAQAARIPMVMSGTSLVRLEEVAAECPGAWFQAYLPGDPKRIAPLIDRVAAAGFTTLMVTVDVAVLPNRENNVRAGFSTPLRPSLRLAWDGLVRPRWLLGTFLRTLLKHGMPHFENSFAERGAPILARNVERDFSQRDHLDWGHLAQIRKQWKGPLAIKGILDVEDAKRARALGADAIVVSNHGGRQLDGSVSPRRVLPAIRDAAGDMAVTMDGGIRRASDVLKALALGAHFVWVGRPFNYAAAIAAEEGVAHAIAILAAEIHRDMALLGINTLAEMTPARLMRVAGVRTPGMPV
jgi:L-lactate dehydrogenase (cytochrome)